MVKRLGATKTINYKDPTEFDTFIADYEGKVDFVYDTVTSAEDPDYFHKIQKLLKPNSSSKYMAINGRKVDFFWYGMFKPLMRVILDSLETQVGSDKDLSGFLFPEQNYDLIIMTPQTLLIERMVAIMESNHFKGEVVIDSVFDLNHTADLVSAFMKLKSRRAIGKIVIKP